MSTRMSLSWMFLTSFFCASLYADSMPWTGTRDNATVTNGTQVYSQNFLTPLDPNLPDGPLKMIDTTNEVSWFYNPHIYSQAGVQSQWHWRIGDTHKWDFDIVSQTFKYQGGNHTWERFGGYGQDWLNPETEEQWEFQAFFYAHGYIDLWRQVVTEEATEVPEQGIWQWGYDFATDTWKCIERDISWQLDQKNLRWNRVDTSEQWTFNPKLETWSYTGPGATANRWKLIKRNRWVEEYSGEEWLFSVDGTHGGWQKEGSALPWTYSTGTKMWQEMESGNTGYFPPHLPYIGLHQVSNIWHIHQDVINANLFDTSTPFGPNTWTDGTNTLTVDSSPASAGFRMVLGDLGITVGRSGSYGFSTFGGWESTGGEKFNDSTNDGVTQSYNNNSLNITGTSRDTIYRHQNSNTWWRMGFDNHTWLFYIGTNKWHNAAMDEWFTYDFKTLTWTLDGTSKQWTYVNDGGTGDWVWQQVGTSEKWRYNEEVPAGQNPAVPASWTEVSTGEKWKQLGNHLYNIDTLETWQYDTVSHLWYKDGDTGTTGKDLFPQVMPNIVGYAGALSHLALTETVSTSPRHSATGFLGRINARRAEYETLQAQFDTVVAGYEGIERYNRMLPIKSQAQDLAQLNMWLRYDYNGIYNLYKSNSSYLPTSANFDLWNPTYWRFITPGKGATLLGYSAWTSLKIGLAANPTTDGSADFSIVINPTTTTTEEGPEEAPVLRHSFSSCEVKVYQGDTLLTTESLTVMPAKHDESGFINMGNSSIWLTLNEGKITMGREDPTTKFLIPNAYDIFFEYQLTDTTAASSLQYYSVSHLTENPLAGTGVTVRPQEFAYFDTQARSVDMWNQTVDQLQFSKLQELLVRAKAHILALATTDTTHRERLERILVNKLDTKLSSYAFMFSSYLEGGFNEGDGFMSAATKPWLTNLVASCTEGATAIAGLKTYLQTLVPDLEAGLDQLIDYDASLVTDADGRIDLSEEGVIAGVRGGIFAKVSALITALSGSMATAITDFSNVSGNEDMAPFNNFFQEEIKVMQNVNTIMTTMEKILYERLLAQAKLYQTDPTAAANAADDLLAVEAQNNSEKEAIFDLLATQLSSGTTNLFAVIAAPAMVLAFGSTFDEVRRRTNQLLTQLGETDFHTIPSEGHPLRDYATAREKIVSIVREVELILRQEGNQFYEAFEGDVFSIVEPPEDKIVAQELTAASTTTIDQQQVSMTPGTSDKYRTNVEIKTAAGEGEQGVVREVKIEAESKLEAPTRVFVKDAILALGNGNFSADSGNSLSVLGSTQISPEGNATITLNSDILIMGNEALLPTKNFGDDQTTATRCVPDIPLAQLGQHELRFHSDTPRTITIARDVDLNLTGFGKGRTKAGQSIVFSGQVKLVMEPGSRIRLPYLHPDKRDYGLVMNFVDEAELVCLGTENRDEARWSDALNGSDKVRCKLLGTGVIEFAGNAKMKIMRSALVGIEGDYTSNITDITLRLKEAGKVYIGDETTAGGALQVGNVVDGGWNHTDLMHYPNTNAHPNFGDTDAPFEPRRPHVDFSIVLDGRDAKFFMGREAFLGFGVGTVNKKGNPNGTTPDAATDPATDANQFNAWRVQSLHNFGNLVIDVANGTFSHHQVALGDDKNSSVIAFGPQVSRANYRCRINKKRSDALMGGGNVMLLRAGIPHDDPLPLRIWDNVDDLTGGIGDNGKSSILAPSSVLSTRFTPDPNDSEKKSYNRAAVKEDSSFYQITGPLDEVYLATTMQSLNADGRQVVVTKDQHENKATFVDGNTIKTKTINQSDILDSTGDVADSETAAEKGVLKPADTEAEPEVFTKPNA